MPQTYTPPQKTLQKYADLAVEFGLRNKDGSRPKPGSVVYFTVPEVAKPLYFYLQRAILTHGHHPIGNLTPSSDAKYEVTADFFRHASPEQRNFHPETYVKGLYNQIDCIIHVLADTRPHELKRVPGNIVQQHKQAQKKGTELKWKKIEDGKLNWTIVLYGTDAMAAEADLTPKQYWQQIISACYLDTPNPTKEWEKINTTAQRTAAKLDQLAIESLHVAGEDIDITLDIGADRRWLAGGGCNIPSYEIFTSPIWQSVNGWVRFNQPRYENGQKIEGVELWLENGKVVKSRAKKNHALLKSMLQVKGGDQIGEFSLTDRRLSRIHKPMAEIMYDENMGGEFGNTHMAIGMAFKECYKHQDKKISLARWNVAGFNQSTIHADFISTTDRTVTATLPNGKTKVIYQNGQFTL